MAFIGLRKPIVAKMDDTGKYGAPFAFGKAISFNETPTLAEATLYADDALAEAEKAVTGYDLSLGTDDIPDTAKADMFGHTAAAGEYQYGSDDNAPYCGFGVIGVKKVNGTRTFEAKFYPKTQWAEPSVSYQTRGENTEFATPSTTGKALVDANNNFKYEESFDTEAEAVSWIRGKMGSTSGKSST